jgi:hypothetical protein
MVVIQLESKADSPPSVAKVYIVTSHLSSQPIQRFVTRQHLCKHATIMQALLGSRPHVTMDLQWEAVFSMWSASTLYHASYQFSYSQFRMRYSRQLSDIVK